MKSGALLVGLVVLAGCAGPRPPLPREVAITPPQAWRGQAAAGGELSSDWWKAFGDPALTQVVQDALAHNDDIAIAAERVEEARAQFRLAQAQRLPDVAGGVEGGRERDVNPGFGVPEKQSFGGGVVDATWDLDLFGRLRNASQAARAALTASQDARDAVRLAVASSAAEGYITLRSLDARLDVLRRTLAARAEALRVARRRSEAGYAAELDLRQAEAEYHAAEQLIPATELAIRREEDGLSLLLGATPGAVERGSPLDDLAPPDVPAGLPSSLLRRRPDVAAAEAKLVAQDRSLDAVRASFLPDIKLSGEGGGVVSSLIEQNPTGIYTIEASILGPIFDSGRLRAQQAAAAARRDQAAFEYRKTALSAFRDVEDALAAIQRSGEQEKALAGRAGRLRRHAEAGRGPLSVRLFALSGADRRRTGAALDAISPGPIAHGPDDRHGQPVPGAGRRLVVS